MSLTQIVHGEMPQHCFGPPNDFPAYHNVTQTMPTPSLALVLEVLRRTPLSNPVALVPDGDRVVRMETEFCCLASGWWLLMPQKPCNQFVVTLLGTNVICHAEGQIDADLCRAQGESLFRSHC